MKIESSFNILKKAIEEFSPTHIVSMVSGGKEAAALYPKWHEWLTDLEKEALKLHGFGWGQPSPKPNKSQGDLFAPMCKDCLTRGTK
jgi:hypothetical protein